MVNKVDELSTTFYSYGIHVGVLTETWLSGKISNGIIDLSGFSVVKRDRPDRRGGGGVYIRDNIPFVQLHDLVDPQLESSWLLLKPHRLPHGINSLILGAIYHPPGNDDRVLVNHITESLDGVLCSHPNAGIIIAGDFNQFKHGHFCNLFNLKQTVKHRQEATTSSIKCSPTFQDFTLFQLSWPQLASLIITQLSCLL